MATRPTPALLLLLVALLLPAQTCMEPMGTAPAPTAIPDGNSSAGRPLPGIELKAAARTPHPAPGPLDLLAMLIPLALQPVLG